MKTLTLPITNGTFSASDVTVSGTNDSTTHNVYVAFTQADSGYVAIQYKVSGSNNWQPMGKVDLTDTEVATFKVSGIITDWRFVVAGASGTGSIEVTDSEKLEDIHPLSFYGETGGMTPEEIGGSIMQGKSAKAPEGFNWPETLPEVIAYKSGNQYDCNLKPEDLIDFSQFTNIQYVDINRPDSSGDGTSWTTAHKAIGDAIDAAELSGLPTRILVKSGDYIRNYSITNSHAAKSITVPICVESIYGRSSVGVYDDLSWTPNSTYPNVYEATRSNAQLAFSTALIGHPELLKDASSLSECAAIPGSFYTDNVTVYIHSKDSGRVTNENHRVVLNAIGASFYSNEHIYFKGFDFYGGNYGCFSINQGETNRVVHEDCKAFFAAGGVFGALTGFDGYQILGCEIFAAFDCEASKNGKDGFNLHKNGAVIPSGLFVNCKGYENGVLTSSQSCNGITTHDGVKCIDIGGDWRGSVGTNAGHVNDDTQVWHFGSIAGDSVGDTYNGGSITYGAFGVWSGTTEVWLDSCRSVGSIIGVQATAPAKAYIRDFSGTGSLSGDVTEY